MKDAELQDKPQKNDVCKHHDDCVIMRRDDMYGYTINDVRFNIDDGAYFDNVEFRFERMNRYFYCFMDNITSRIFDRPDIKEVRDALVWANVKCWLKNKYGKDYYKQYVKTYL